MTVDSYPKEKLAEFYQRIADIDNAFETLDTWEQVEVLEKAEEMFCISFRKWVRTMSKKNSFLLSSYFRYLTEDQEKELKQIVQSAAAKSAEFNTMPGQNAEFRETLTRRMGWGKRQ